MLNIIWNTRGYFFWLLAISLFCWLLERLAPWRKEQKAWRKQIGQDFFWLIFNGHYAGLLIAYLSSWVIQQLNHVWSWWHVPPPETIRLLAEQPWLLQFAVFLVLRDFLEWCVHNLLHRVPWLWEFHKLHHSIEELDWIGNMRFHWMEIVVYKSLTYLPLVMLGVREDVILPIALVTTLIGHLNHSNLNISWGPLRYIINSPRMHVWHHDLILRGQHGKNFGIVFSLWDWIFGTAYMPPEGGQPERLGFEKMEEFPRRLLPRLVYPFLKPNRKNFEKG
jgi:sterol desaturase/sphingolipid hydroxylase (fatty acid hydroxylase superfamily)